jgi:DNA-binding MarR family transcriptional regulator
MPGDLRREIQQRRRFGSAEEEVFLNVLRTAAVLTRALTEVLRPHDLSQPQYNVLRILRGAGPDGLPSGDVALRMLNYDPDVTRLLDRLESRGLVARARGAADRRVVVARLTAEGRRLVDALDAPVRAMHARRLGHLGAADLRTLAALLEAARAESG